MSDATQPGYVARLGRRINRQFRIDDSGAVDPSCGIRCHSIFFDRDGERRYTPEAVEFVDEDNRFLSHIEIYNKYSELSDFPHGATCRVVINDRRILTDAPLLSDTQRKFNFVGSVDEFLVYLSTAITLVVGRRRRGRPARIQTIVNMKLSDPSFNPFGDNQRDYVFLSEVVVDSHSQVVAER